MAENHQRIFWGVLESPLQLGTAFFGERLAVAGWAFLDGQLDSVRARIGAKTSELHTGMARPDVEEVFSGCNGASAAGFVGFLDISDLPAGSYELTVAASGGNTTVHEWHRKVELTDADVVYRQWRQRVLENLADHTPCVVDPEYKIPVMSWIVFAGTYSTSQDLQNTLASLEEGRGAGLVANVVVLDEQARAHGETQGALMGEYVGVLRSGDRLAPGAMRAIARAMTAAPPPDLIYFDHDHLDEAGRIVAPVFKPGWSPLLMRHPAVSDQAWICRSEIFGEGLQNILTDSAQLGSLRLPLRLASSIRITEHLALPLISLKKAATFGIPAPSHDLDSRARAWPRVSVIVPSCVADQEMLARCLNGLRASTHYADVEIIVVLNNLGAIGFSEARDLLAPWSAIVIHVDGPFNWSALNNAGAAIASGSHLLFLNDDVEPLRPEWLHSMVVLIADQSEYCGVVGALLRYPDGSIQHAGVYINCDGDPDCRHTFRHCSGQEPRIAAWLSHDRTQTAVTGACLLTRRDTFVKVHGFDESLPIVFNDVDYCLRVRELGLHSAVAAGAELRHHEGFSRGGMAEGADHLKFRARWAAKLPSIDPYSHPSLDRLRDDWAIDPHAATDLVPLSRRYAVAP